MVATGENNPTITLRANRKFLAAIDNWRRKQTPIPNRSEAIRELVGFGLVSEAPKKPAK